MVEEVNAVQQGNVVELDNGLTIDLDELASPEDRRAKYNRVKAAVREAWNATTIMDGFDMELKFKTHYNQNRNTLKSMCDDLGISTYSSRPTTTTRPIPRPTSSTASTRNSAQPRPSAAYHSSNSKPVKKEMNPIVAVIIIHVIWGLFGLSDGFGGFLGAMFAGIAGWIIPINFLGYVIIEWIYNQINE